MARTALVVGATGLVGKHLVESLLISKAYDQVKILSRRKLAFEHKKISYILLENFDLLINVKDQISAQDVFCCLGTTIKTAGSKEKFYQVDYEYPIKIGELALANQAQQFLLISAMGANAKSSIFYNKVKGEVEKAIKTLGYKSVHIFRPSILLGKREEKRIGEKVGIALMQTFAPLMLGGLKKYKPIKAKDVAMAMHNCAFENTTGTLIHESDKIKKLVK
jgi:uncharacterized protein YbjT (DUF2867 family)